MFWQKMLKICTTNTGEQIAKFTIFKPN